MAVALRPINLTIARRRRTHLTFLPGRFVPLRLCWVFGRRRLGIWRTRRGMVSFRFGVRRIPRSHHQNVYTCIAGTMARRYHRFEFQAGPPCLIASSVLQADDVAQTAVYRTHVPIHRARTNALFGSWSCTSSSHDRPSRRDAGRGHAPACRLGPILKGQRGLRWQRGFRPQELPNRRSRIPTLDARTRILGGHLEGPAGSMTGTGSQMHVQHWR